jgi:hypothetical protein
MHRPVFMAGRGWGKSLGQVSELVRSGLRTGLRSLTLESGLCCFCSWSSDRPGCVRLAQPGVTVCPGGWEILGAASIPLKGPSKHLQSTMVPLMLLQSFVGLSMLFQSRQPAGGGQ